MQVTPQHAEAIGERTGISVEERLFFDRIALHAADVSPWDEQRPAAIETHLADAGLAFRDGAAVSAGVAADPVRSSFS